MSSALKHIQKFFLLSVISIFLLSSAAIADTSSLLPPYIQYTGNYSYDADAHLLSITDLVFQAPITYSDGSYAFSSSDDPILGSVFAIGDLYNSDTDKLAFGSASGETGPVTFSVPGYYTAALGNFVATQENATKVMAGSIGNISVTEGSGSRYMDEIGGYSLNLFMSFTPDEGYGLDGVDKFNEYSVGSVSGQLQVVPEPVSSVLFLTGGSAFLLRRRFKKNK